MLLVKALLDELGLRSFPKTTGRACTSIVVPLARKHAITAGMKRSLRIK